ncbi:serine protease 38-like isoform 1-T1 [Sarcophilus harrisii]|uniref:Peptidase S1 domain-containing protein n=1 Tax=Sarcophilus harrisii TaxID=9305 RepID=A0A7N4V112_SARHA
MGSSRLLLGGRRRGGRAAPGRPGPPLGPPLPPPLLLLLLLLLPSCGCWKSNSECGRPFREGKIIGGQDALDGKWPWQVTFFFRGYHTCGGSILSKYWVLTAAHCFDQTLDLLEHFKVYVGLTDLKSINSHIQKRGIKQVIIHPLYKLTHPNGHDIALVQLSKALKFNYLVLPVCLPKSNINLDTTETCWITGWGKMRESGIMVDILQETEIPLLDQFLCQILYGSIFFIQEDMICAADLSLMKSPCQGDSGGPLVCKFNDTWIQIGVVTWGKGCSIPLYPGVFARVPYFSTWISNSIQSVIISRSTIIAVSWMTLSTALLFLHVLRTQ